MLPHRLIALTHFPLPTPIVFDWKSNSIDRRKLTATLCCNMWLLAGERAWIVMWHAAAGDNHALQLSSEGDNHAQATPALHLCFTACTVVQAFVKATSQSNEKGQILTPWGSETPERISMKRGIYNLVCPQRQIHVALWERGWSGRTR